MHTTPASLLEQLRVPSEDPDSRQAWERLVELYTPLLYHWARRIGLQEADAADLVQDVFAILVRKLPQFTYDRHKSFRAWLYTVTQNRWREKQRRRVVPAGDNPRKLDELADYRQAEETWETVHRQEFARHALELMQAEFQPNTWRAFWECATLGRAAGEVGAELGMTAAAVRAARFRVLARLRQELAGLLE